jgi:phosphomannomutase/phosphoglucomutase
MSAALDPAVSAGSLSMRGRMRLLMFAGALLVILPVLLVGILALLQLQSVQQAQAERAASVYAGIYGQWVQQQAHLAGQVSGASDLAGLFTAGDAAALSARASALARLFPGASALRLYPAGIDEVDLQASPPISYALLDMFRQSETGVAPLMEVYAIAKEQYLSLVRPVSDANGNVVGHLMVSYPAGDVFEQLINMPEPGYIELQQAASAGTLLIGGHGEPAGKNGVADSEQKVPGSRWRVVYWGADAGTAFSRLLMVAVAAATLAGALLLVLVWWVFRAMTASLKTDQATLLAILKDVRDGRGKQAYRHALDEMGDTIQLMARAASTLEERPKNGPKAVAPLETFPSQPPIPPSVTASNVVDELDNDPLFYDDALEIVSSENISSQTPVSQQQPPVSAVPPASMGIYRAYDIRGVVGETLDAELAYAIGRAIGSEAAARGQQTVAVARDGRLSGRELSNALVRGLVATGREVKDIGQAPTPVLYYAAQQLAGGSGVMVTGSHNPAAYNGFKIMLAGETLANAAITGLHRRIQSGDFVAGSGRVGAVDVLPDYVSRICDDVQIARPIKVVVDCGNGVAAVLAPKLLRELGCEVIELYCEVDGRFPNHHPDPSRPENLADLVQAVRAQGAELGIAFDGDGDRLGVVGSRGEIIWPDRVLMLLAMDVLARNPGAVIMYDVKCSRHLAALVSEYGGEPLMAATGHSLIKAKMQETGALLAGEMSGHIFFKERWFGFDDALYAAARLLEILGNDPRSSSELFAELPESLSTPELNIAMAEGEPAAFMHKLQGSAAFDSARVSTIDGLRVEFDRGWGLVRASNTTPSLVLRFEADDELALSTIQDEFRRVMLQVDPDLSLPF